MRSMRRMREYRASGAAALCCAGRAVLLAILFGLSTGPLRAAPVERWADFAGTIFHNLPIDNELPRQATRQILEDRDGFLWIAAYGGLARWDGYRFHVYPPNPKRPGALPDNFIEIMHNDSSGRLWIGTNGMGLVRYDRENDRFINFRSGRDGLSHNTVSGLADDGEGGLWVATLNGLDRFDPTRGRAIAEPLVSDDGQLRSTIRMQTVFRARQGTLWIGTEVGLYRRDQAKGQFTRVKLDPAAAVPSRIYEDRAGRIWVGTTNRGAFVVSPNDTAGQPVREPGIAQPALPGERVMSIVEARPGEIWIGTQTKGIVAIPTDGSAARHIVNVRGVPSSLADNGVNGLYHDRAGLLWVASARGIGFHDLTQKTVTTLFGGAPGRYTISEANITAVEELEGGRVWLGLRNGGIDILDPASGQIERIRPDSNQPDHALPAARVLSIAATSNGQVYVGTEKGLYRTDQEGKTIERLTLTGRPADGRVDAVLADGETLWFGGLAGGLWSIALNAESAPARHVSADLLSDPRITVRRRDRDGAIWIGTWSGINRFDPATGRIEKYVSDPNDDTTVNRGFVSSLMIDRRGRLWVGTLAGGLGILEQRDADGRPRFRRFGTADGMPNNSPNMILEDRTGRIWTSSDHGLAAIDPDSFAIHVLRESDGVTVRNFWVHSGATTSAGEMLFGGTGGLVIVRPETVAASSYRPPVVITDIRIGRQIVPAGRFNSGDTVPMLEIPADTNSFSVEFASLDFAASSRISYRYRLVGFDADWIATDATRRVAHYTNLWPGTYRLSLAGTNSDGVWTEKILTIPVQVMPAWYQTVWFMLAVMFAVFSLIWLLVHVRTMLLHRRGVELEALIGARTAELQQSNEELRTARVKLERLTEEDALTGLANRRMLRAQLDRALARAHRRSSHIALLFIDLDRFKEVNDRHGHRAGDELLRQVAQRLRPRLREVDTVARLGGDEFVVLLEDIANVESASVVARAIIEMLTQSFSLDGNIEVTVGASIGIALYPDAGRDADGLLDNADHALYQAKSAGRNQYRIFESAPAAQQAATIA